MPGMELTTTVTDDCVMIAVLGEVDIAAAPALHDAIAAATRSHRRTVLDLTASRYFDSSGLRVLLVFAEQLTEVVISAEGTVSRVFELTNLDEVFPVRRVRPPAGTGSGLPGDVGGPQVSGTPSPAG